MTTEDPLRTLDWKEARERMIRVISGVSKGRLRPEDIEDLAQTACIGLMRVVRRGDVKSLEAMQVTIAYRAAVNRLKKKGISIGTGSKKAVDLDEVIDRLGVARADADGALAPEEAQFYVGEILSIISAGCRELFEHWKVVFNLKLVADRLGISHETARQRWVRCRRKTLEILALDAGPLGALAREQG